MKEKKRGISIHTFHFTDEQMQIIVSALYAYGLSERGGKQFILEFSEYKNRETLLAIRKTLPSSVSAHLFYETLLKLGETCTR